jgi:hypothetical protein
VPAGVKPLLVVDVWERAFMRDCRATEWASTSRPSSGTSTNV